MITKIYNVISRGLLYCGVAVALAACSDTWDDHYDSMGSGSIHEGSLWQAIKSNPDLSNFASVVEACDFAKSLDGSQVFTVFAPTNSNFSKGEADALINDYKAQKNANVLEDDNTVLKEFVQNHVALYNHSVSSESHDSILLMNGKYAVLTSTDIDGVQMLSKNQLYGNGVLYTLSNKVKFLSNVFEYVAKDPELDSLRSFLYNSKFYYREFLPERSVAGSIVDGRTQYLDSVFMQRNDLFGYLGQLNLEDSTYMMIAPTNDVWKNLVEEYEQYFNYPASLTNRDSMVYTSTRLAIVNGTTFSRTFNPDKVLSDSAFSVSSIKGASMRKARWGAPFEYYQYYKPRLKPFGVLSQDADDIVKCSNGEVYKSSEWNIDKLMTFNKFLIYEAEGRSLKEMSRTKDSRGDSVNTVTPFTRQVSADSRYYNKVWDNRFVEFQPNFGTLNHSVTFTLSNVLSNIGYDIYLVTAPALASDSNAVAEVRVPTIMRCTLNVPGKGDVPIVGEDGKSKDFKTTPDAVDYLLLAEDYKFDVCTYDVNDENMQVTLKVETRVSNSQLRNNTYTRTMRLDCVLLVPHGTLQIVDELPEGTPYAGRPGIMMFPHGTFTDRPIKWWYMQR
ncbi:MAG: fasciclin domain-containing protein [Prevotella sp.]|nr:fasciclin domain-containing protein [Prevotella sp.]